MWWKEELERDGIGVMGTSNKKGEINLAIYSPPIVVDESTVVFGATHRVTYSNLTENPHAMFMYITEKWKGVRLALRLKKVETEGKMLELIKENFKKIGYTKLAKEIKYALYFEVKEALPLKGR
ncbi:pyridoxamine 5'-phosphate oxidase family protein [Thermosulfidibacter takaii]|nr:pyridoxamine 5'-phosphate oxidase family protein [Thermosulfidibacter takaii]